MIFVMKTSCSRSSLRLFSLIFLGINLLGKVLKISMIYNDIDYDYKSVVLNKLKYTGVDGFMNLWLEFIQSLLLLSAIVSCLKNRAQIYQLTAVMVFLLLDAFHIILLAAPGLKTEGNNAFREIYQQAIEEDSPPTCMPPIAGNPSTNMAVDNSSQEGYSTTVPLVFTFLVLVFVFKIYSVFVVQLYRNKLDKERLQNVTADLPTQVMAEEVEPSPPPSYNEVLRMQDLLIV